MSTVRESDVLRLLIENAASNSVGVVEGVGDQDDCAVLRIPPDEELCVTTDFVRGTGFHLFRTGHLSLEDVGYYVVAANVSDLASMGAKPLGYLSVVRYKSDRTIEEINGILRGISAACTAFECPLVGGDTGSYEADVLSGTALGTVRVGHRLSRKTMRPEQALFVSGDLGRPAAALAVVSNDIQQSVDGEFQDALAKWRRPTPRIQLGMELAAAELPIGCMDVSDGLTASLQQLTRIANCGFKVDTAALPINPSVRRIAECIKTDPVHLACSASVDFELLFSAPVEESRRVMEMGDKLGIPISHIGYTTLAPSIVMTKGDGDRYEALPGTPWDHQVSDITKVFRRDGGR